MSNFYHNIRPVTVPHIKLRVNGNTYWDVEDVIMTFIALFLIAIVGTVVLGFAIHIYHHVTLPGPKVVTKIVKEDGLTTAQHEFIQSCERNTNSENNPGVPDVTVHPYTCTYAKFQ